MTTRSQRSLFLKPDLAPDSPFTSENLNRVKISVFTKPELRKLSLSKEDEGVIVKLHKTEKRRIYTQTHRKKEDNRLFKMESDIIGLKHEKKSLIVEKQILEGEIQFYRANTCSGGFQS